MRNTICATLTAITLILRRRANIEHISLGYQRIDTATRDTR